MNEKPVPSGYTRVIPMFHFYSTHFALTEMFQSIWAHYLWYAVLILRDETADF